MHSTASYNTKEGITSRLTTLDSLGSLIRDRMAASEAGEKLSAFILLGSWVLDSSGYLCRLNITYNHKTVLWVKALAPVVGVEDFFAMFPDGRGAYLETQRASIPAAQGTCHLCGSGWTLGTLTDAHEVLSEEGGTKHMHLACHNLEQSIKAWEYYTKIFTEAGFTNFVLAETPNEYDNSVTSTPWALCHTVYGVVKVGWRKNVILIDWSDTGKDFMGLFVEEQVTKGSDYIHAWGRPKAVDYLQKIWAHLVARGLIWRGNLRSLT